MLRSSKKWLPVLLVLGLFRDCQGWNPSIMSISPIMSPAKPEIYIDEGDSLQLACTSAKTMIFYYPQDVADTIKTSLASLKKQSLSGEQQIIFRRSQTVYGDTGWYGCADHDTDVTPGIYDQPGVSWTYVYVRSKTRYFVQADEFQSVRKFVGGNAILPCRPTSPHYKVSLNANSQEIRMGERVSYDPRFGFSVTDIRLDDTNFYQCVVEDGDNIQEINFILVAIRTALLNEPEIVEDTLRHVKRGQILYVNCTAIVGAHDPYLFNWIVPQQNSRITTRLYIEPIAGNKRITTCELMINGVTDEDEGEYWCTIKTLSGMRKTKTFIPVYDPHAQYIKLFRLEDNWIPVRNYGDRLQLAVEVDAHPQPILQWFNPSGEEINGTWTEPGKAKYAVSSTTSLTILRINRLDFDDEGLYSLHATNEDAIESAVFILEVIATKPTPKFKDLEKFYLLKQRVQIVCSITAAPGFNVTWTFLKAPNYPSLEGSEIVKLENYSILQEPLRFYSVAIVMFEMSGRLTCTACNIFGCGSNTASVFVSDVPGGYGIIETDKQLTEGDDVEITCAASIYNYTRVEWLTGLRTVLVETDRISTTNSSTNFTHRSTLRIANVEKSDNGSYYVCRITSEYRNTIYRDRQYKLLIYERRASIISETNMNNSTITLDLRSDGHKTIVLKCHVRGSPKPTVTWYKDDRKISANEQYEYRYDNQELYINYFHAENSGKYSCKVENRFGKDEIYQIISIKVKEASKVLLISIVVLVLICVIFVIYFSIKLHREKVMRKKMLEAGLTHFEEGAVQCLNPNLTVDGQAELLPYDNKWEFPRERLRLERELGFGAFGVVAKAHALGICKDEAVSTVAVKMVRKSTDSIYIRALACELKIMVHLGKHLNVVNLLGACTKNIMKRELLVIVEYCHFGNLHDYLLRQRANFINQIDPATRKLDPSIGLDALTRPTSVESNSLSENSSNSNRGAEIVSYTAGTDSPDISISQDDCVLSNNSTHSGWRSTHIGDHKNQNLKLICTQDLLSWAFQVARGMEYLNQRKVLHGDLAARNILLAENNIVKISDFGLAKTMYNDDNYKKKGGVPLPIKWMAIESIKDRIFSTQSDVWSFGIVLWEFFTLAETPYPTMGPERQYQKLIEGYRMEQPEYATDEAYKIMLQCWKAKPALRPTFAYLVSSIGDLLEKCVKEYYMDLNNPYMDMNTRVFESGKDDYLTMMSAPDYDALVSPNNDYVNSPSRSSAIPQDESYIPMRPSNHGGDSGVFSPRITSNCCENNFLTSNGKSNAYSDSESKAVELSPMLNQEDDDCQENNKPT